MKHNILIIGAGSAGSIHLRGLNYKKFNIYVLDTDKKKRIKIQKKFNILNFSSKKEDFKTFKFDLIIIANLAPDHRRVFEYFYKNSKNFIIEKPIATSVEDIDKIFEVIKKNNLNVIFHHQRDFFEVNEIKKLFTKFNSKPQHAISFGGNNCIITTGIHTFNTVCEVFNEIPKYISASIIDDKINPRSKKLKYVSGMVIFYFKNGRRYTIDISNKTNIKSRTFITSKYLTVETNGKELTYNKFKNPNFKKQNYTLKQDNFAILKLETQSYYLKMINNLLKRKTSSNYYKRKKEMSKSFLSLLNINSIKKKNIKFLNKKYYKINHNVS